MKYEKKKECDLFYKHNYETIRVAIDSDTQKPLKSIQKEKKINLDFHVPNYFYDFRITIAIEFQKEFPKETDIAQRQRDKDRISYYFDNFQIDITVVTESKLDNFGNPILSTGQKTNEIEIELNSIILYKEKLKLDKKEKNYFEFITKEYLNSIRSLVKMCEPNEQQQQPPPNKKFKK